MNHMRWRESNASHATQTKDKPCDFIRHAPVARSCGGSRSRTGCWKGGACDGWKDHPFRHSCCAAGGVCCGVLFKAGRQPGDGLYQRERRGGTDGSGSPMARPSMRSRRLGSWANVLVCTSMGKRSWRSKLQMARHVPPAKRQGTLRFRLNMEHGIPMASRGPVPTLPTGRMPAKRWTPTMSINVQRVAPPPSCKPGQRTGGSATDRADNPEESQKTHKERTGVHFADSGSFESCPSSTGRLIQPKSKGRGLPDG